MWRRTLSLVTLAALTGVCGTGGGGGGGGGGDEGVSVGPVFAPQSSDVVGVRGDTVALRCRVLRLADRTVSWVRSRDLQILSHAGAAFTADARVTAGVERDARGEGSVHTLNITRLRSADAGRYECQVNTEPKMSLFFNLTVFESPLPVATVRVAGERVLRARAGTGVTLRCEGRYEPVPPPPLPLPLLHLHWLKDDERIDLQRGRENGGGEVSGGVSLETERWGGGGASVLTLAGVRARDAGAYTCAAPGAADTVALRVLPDDDQGEVMQRDQSVSGARIGSAGRAERAGRAAPGALLAAVVLVLRLAPLS